MLKGIKRIVRILQIAPIVERVPPKKYGGTERVVYALTEELINRGHQITLCATGDSITSGELFSVYPNALREANIEDFYEAHNWKMLHIGKAYEIRHRFDIIHDHSNGLSVPLANMSDVPVVTTLHGAITPRNRRLYEALKKPYYVTISQSQAKAAPRLHHAGTVYNGLNMGSYPFSRKNDGYLLFVGRIAIEKGVHYAIEAAEYLNLPLIIAAKLDSGRALDTQYFKEHIEPHLSDQIKWIGEVGEDERNKLMSKALCLLHPATWAEPFGLVLIEAMACGCPVIAFDKGSIPEIIVDGKTGFVVDNLRELTEAVRLVDVIDRKACRDYALSSFNAERMADGYEDIYQLIIGESLVYDRAILI